MMLIQYKKPVRRTVPQQQDYAQYREDLRIDFNNACGYCDDSDLRTDKSCFHIDHFAPKKRFPLLINVYTNLVYACRFCNIRKRDHWIGVNPAVHNDGQKGFVDPCSTDYDEHLERDTSGRIFSKTELGHYMVNQLSLNLMRHQLLWNARRSRGLRNEVESLMNRIEQLGLQNNEQYFRLMRSFIDLTKKIEAYELSAVS